MAMIHDILSRAKACGVGDVSLQDFLTLGEAVDVVGAIGVLATIKIHDAKQDALSVIAAHAFANEAIAIAHEIVRSAERRYELPASETLDDFFRNAAQ